MDHPSRFAAKAGRCGTRRNQTQVSAPARQRWRQLRRVNAVEPDATSTLVRSLMVA